MPTDDPAKIITGFIADYKGARGKCIHMGDAIPLRVLALHKKRYLNLAPGETPLILLDGSWLFGFMASGLVITSTAIHYSPSNKPKGVVTFTDARSLEIGSPELDARGNYVGSALIINGNTAGLVRMGKGISYDDNPATLLNCLFNTLATRGILERPVDLSFRLLEEKAMVRAKPSLASPIIEELENGAETILEKTKKGDGLLWLYVTLPDGRRGYIPGSVKTTMRYIVSLGQESVAILDAPAIGAAVKRTMMKGEPFTMIRAVTEGDVNWIRIRTASGDEGYVPGETLYFREGSQEPEPLWSAVIVRTAEALRPGESKGLAKIFILPGALLGYGLGKIINNRDFFQVSELALAGAAVGWVVGQVFAFVRSRE